MSQKTKHGMHIVLTGVAFLFIIIAVSYVWSQINVKGQKDKVIDVEIGVEEQEVDKLIAEAYALDKPGTKKEALALFEEIVQKYPNSDRLPEIYFRMGVLAWQTEAPEKPIEYFQKIITAYPDYPDMPSVVYWLGHAYEAAKDYPKELATYQQVIDRWPNTEIAQQAGYTKGMHHYWQGAHHQNPEEYEKAIAEFRKVVENDRAETDKWKNSAVFSIGESYLGMKKYDEAVAAFQERLDRFGPIDQAQYMIGVTYRQAGRYTEAIATFSKLVQQYPSFEEAPTAQWLIGEMLEMQGKLTEATGAYQTVISLFPDSSAVKGAQYRIKMIQTGEDPMPQIGKEDAK